MKTILLYESKHGASEKVAMRLKREQDTCMRFNEFKGNLATYDRIVLGCGIYASTLAKSFKQFCNTHEDLLANKEVYVYLCGLQSDEETIQKVCSEQLSPTLLPHIRYIGCVGATLNFPTLSFFEKTIIKMINKKAHFVDQNQMKEEVDLLLDDRIIHFQNKLKNSD